MGLRDCQNAVRNATSNCQAQYETYHISATASADDLHSNCLVWATAGMCESSPEVMHVVCKTSCKTYSFDKTLGAGWTLDLSPSRPLGCCCDYNEFCIEWA